MTLRHDLDNLSKFYEWAVKMGYATYNPVRQVKKPSIEDAVRMYILSDAEAFLYFELALARRIDLHDVATLIVNQGMRPEEVIEIEKKNVDLIARTLRIPKGKTKAAKRTLRLTTDSFEVLKRRIQDAEQSEAQLKDLCERVAKRLKIAPGKVADRERLKALYVFPARKSGKTGKGHISLSALENCHNDVLDACKEKGRIIPFVLYDLRHTFATRAAQGECRCQRLRPSWDTLRCGRLRSTSTQHRTINGLRWIVSTESGRRASTIRRVSALSGPRWARGDQESGGFPQTRRERWGNRAMTAHRRMLLSFQATTAFSDLSEKGSWRRGSGSNRRIKVLQTFALPLGYRALAGEPLLAK